MGNLFKRFSWLQLMLGILLIVAGIVTIAVSIINTSVLDTTLSIIIAVILFALGGFIVLDSYLESPKSIFSTVLVEGAIFIAIGVLLCIERNLISNILVYFVSILAITLGVVGIIKGMLLVKYRAKPIIFVLMFFFAAVCLALGICALIFKNTILVVLYISIGALIVSLGIAETIFGVQNLKKK